MTLNAEQISTLAAKSANSALVKDIMTTRVVTVDLDDRLHVIRTIFENVSFNHLLVLEDNKLVGLLSYRDYLAALSPRIGTAAEFARDTRTLEQRVHQVMSHNPITISPNTSIKTATEVLLEHKIGSLPVVEDDKVIGIITWKDLLSVYLVINA
ncbi:CBS domain-containing protein [Shewanella maritima]|uniref:CBS domain-containing protein n=1 Tax=Shewanella maritima TaxID=2520507 RepID=A0A411PLV9_9GAMM|nr:CBS domain-containing protein [Shewanella maritima]QBF84540.1 CBS domain-containing protein [Shewanella maritima]